MFSSINLSAQSIPDHKVIALKIGDSFKVGNFNGFLKNIERVSHVDGVVLTDEDIALRAELVLVRETDTLLLCPIYVLTINDRMEGYLKASDQEFQISVTMTSILPKKSKFVFDFLTGSNAVKE